MVYYSLQSIHFQQLCQILIILFIIYHSMAQRQIGENGEITYIDSGDNLGSGYYGIVFFGYKTKNKNQRYAVKRLYLSEHRQVENYKRQMEILPLLKHENLIQFYKVIKDHSLFYIVTELCNKQNLQQVIKKSKGLDEKKVMKYAYEIVCAIRYLHYALKIIHRDLKTQNIFLKIDTIKVGDFGCSKHVTNTQDVCSKIGHTIVGTPIYSSPQLTNQQKYSAKCDIWGIGCIIYEMLTGQKLFETTSLTKLKQMQDKRAYQTKIKNNLKSKNKFWTDLLLNKILIYEESNRCTAADLHKIFEQEMKKITINKTNPEEQKLFNRVMQEKQKYSIFKKIGENNQIVFDESDVLGTGAFGTVFGGIMNKDANQRVAVKLLHLKQQTLFKKNSNFKREIDILKKLNNPYIIKFYCFYVDPISDSVYIVTERCQSQDLSKLILQKQISSERIFKYIYQLVYAMAYMHKQGILHRDIKPENILFTSEDNIKISDLSLGKSILKDNIQSLAAHTISGTPLYAAPQIVQQLVYSGKCDVWSTGCLVYQMLKNKKLFANAKTMKLLKLQQKKFQQPNQKQQILKQIPDKFWNSMLSKMLTYQDQQRPSFRDLLPYFRQQNKKKYQLEIEGEQQRIMEVQQKTKTPIKRNENPGNFYSIQKKQIGDTQKKKPYIKILTHNTHQASQKMEEKKPKMKIGPIRRIISNPSNQFNQATQDLMNIAQKIQQIKKIFDRAFMFIDFKYEKIKLTYRYLYQFQQAKNFPIEPYHICIIATLIILWHKMEILEFINQFKSNDFMMFEGQKITLQRNQANETFLNKRNKMLNEFSQKIGKLDGYMQQYVDYIFKDKFKNALLHISKKHPQLINILQNCTKVSMSSQKAVNIFKTIFKEYGMPFDTIEQLEFQQKLKIYRLIASLVLLSKKQQKFPDSLLNNRQNIFAGNEKDKMKKKFQEIEVMTKQEVMEIIK